MFDCRHLTVGDLNIIFDAFVYDPSSRYWTPQQLHWWAGWRGPRWVEWVGCSAAALWYGFKKCETMRLCELPFQIALGMHLMGI